MHDRVCPPRRMRFSLESRCRIVALIVAGESPQAAAAACGASRATGYRLWRRYQSGGWQALVDRSSTPRRQPRRLAPVAEQEILRWRTELKAGPAVIATIVERPASTVHKVLRRAGCSRLERARRDPRVRYERERTGELLHEIATTRTVVVVEHDMEFLRRFANCVTVMHEGQILCEGSVAEVQADGRVQEVYLGRSRDKRSTAEVG